VLLDAFRGWADANWIPDLGEPPDGIPSLRDIVEHAAIGQFGYRILKIKSENAKGKLFEHFRAFSGSVSKFYGKNTDGESTFARVQIKRLLRRCFGLFWSLPVGWFGDEIWASISNGCLFRNNQPTNNTYVKIRFICTRENFDSPSVLTFLPLEIHSIHQFGPLNPLWNLIWNTCLFFAILNAVTAVYIPKFLHFSIFLLVENYKIFNFLLHYFFKISIFLEL